MKYIDVSTPKYPNTFIIVDDEDYESLNKFKWFLNGRTKYRYAARNAVGDNPRIYMHRSIMGNPKGMFVDHANGDTLDNRKCNLRICTRQQNSRNRKSQYGSKSKFKGVYLVLKPWSAICTCGERQYFLGSFKTEEEAAAAYDAKARVLFGEFARTNFQENREVG